MKFVVFSTLVLTSWLAACASDLQRHFVNVPDSSRVSIVGLDHGPDFPISLATDHSSPSGYLIPKAMEQAANEFRLSLPSEIWQQVVESVANDVSCLEEVDGMIDIASFLYEVWGVGSGDSTLFNEIARQSINVFGEYKLLFGLVLCKAAYDVSRGEPIDLKRLSLDIVLRSFDSYDPTRPPPKECIANSAMYRHTMLRGEDVNIFDGRPRYGWRIMRWISCDTENKVAIYIAGMGWLMSDKNTLEEIIQSKHGRLSLVPAK